jgi:hypothetical protein
MKEGRQEREGRARKENWSKMKKRRTGLEKNEGKDRRQGRAGEG